MGRNEKKLSEYIDSLNEEKKPGMHGQPEESTELSELTDAVRMVRSLKEPALPNADYPKKLARDVADGLSSKSHTRRTGRSFFIGSAAVAAIVIMAILFNFVFPLGRSNVAYAMEQAFNGVKAYHGYLEIVETNAEGTATTQGKLEIWADKEGRYYIKELEGTHKGLITANNGQKKWQIRPEEKKAYVFQSFPDPYRFTFELGKEIEGVKNALKTKVVGEDTVAGRKTLIVEVTPQGGAAYSIWVDKETKLPLQKQSAMQNALQYRATYTRIDYMKNIPSELTGYRLPDGFEEVGTKPELIVNNLEEAQQIAGFALITPKSLPEGYSKESMAFETDEKVVRLSFAAADKVKRVVFFQGRSAGVLEPARTAVLGKIGSNIAEIQSPLQEGLGVLGSGPYAGATDISSIRWQQDGLEYAVLGNISLEEMAVFIKSFVNEMFEMPSDIASVKPQIKVNVDMEAEENEQKSVDAGHSPWRLDPAFVAQVFVSLKISPEGIIGDYPIKAEDLKVTKNNGKNAVIEVGGGITPVRRVYLERLVRQDATGIWTVVGYDPVESKRDGS